MKIHELSTIPIEDRIAHPYAVSYDGDEVLRFSNASAAELFAMLGPADTQRFVALGEPEYLRSAIRPGWRLVTYFNG